MLGPPSLLNNDPRFTFGFFTARLNLVSSTFQWGKIFDSLFFKKSIKDLQKKLASL